MLEICIMGGFKRFRRQGFSLAEILAVLSIFGIVAVAGITSLGLGSKTSRSSADLAYYIADNLRSTRALAKSQGVPVAFVLPSAEGTRPHSQSFHVIRGEHKPRMDSLTNFSSDFPGAALFVGNTGRVGEGPWESNSNVSQFPVEDWNSTPDYQFVFLPTGTCVTNGLPFSTEGGYQIVAASGLEFSGTTLSAAKSAHSVFIGSNGSISVESGAGTARLDGPEGWPSEPAPPPERPKKLDSVIEIQSVEIFPPQPKDLEEQDLAAVVRDGEHLSFEVRATDTAGGPLFCEMAAFRSDGAKLEGFSARGTLRMSWDQNSEEWRQTWHWSPPPGAPVGERYRIEATVKNKRGEEVLQGESVQPLVEKRSGGKFLFTSLLQRDLPDDPRDGNEWGTAVLINDDGSNGHLIPLSVEDDLSSNYFSPDGREVFSRRSGPSGTFFQTYSVDTGRVELEPIAPDAPDPVRAHLSAYRGRDGFISASSGGGLVFVDAESSELQPIAVPPSYGNPASPVLSPDNRSLAFLASEGGSQVLVHAEWDSASRTIRSPRTLLNLPERVQLANFSPDGKNLAMVAFPNRFESFSTWEMRVLSLEDTPSYIRFDARFPDGLSMAWSPNSDEIAGLDEFGDAIQIFALDSPNTVERTVEIPGHLVDNPRFRLRWSR